MLAAIMPATPAWPPQSCPRLFVETPLADGMELRLQGPQAHYLLSVMRFKAGDPLKLFDGISGEWLAVAETMGKRDLLLRVTGKLREVETVPDLWLLAAPIKKARIDLVAEKACELGISRYQPVITRRTIVERTNLDRLRTIMIEAAEQCGRTSLPEIAGPAQLGAVLRDWPPNRALFFADENGGTPLADAVRQHPGPAAFLIGPEGGFDEAERDMICKIGRAVPVTLGPRILRAETAAIAAIAVWMATEMSETRES